MREVVIENPEKGRKIKKSAVTSVCLKPQQLEKFKKLGGSTWLQKVLDETKVMYKNESGEMIEYKFQDPVLDSSFDSNSNSNNNYDNNYDNNSNLYSNIV